MATRSRHGEWIQSYAKIPAAEYRATLLTQFNPVKYDPEAWVIAAKEAGMKYIVITSKHHDGFCLWDSKLTGLGRRLHAPSRGPAQAACGGCRTRNDVLLLPLDHGLAPPG